MEKVNIIYRLVHSTVWSLLNIIWRVKVYYHGNKHKQGSVIVAANHVRLADPLIIDFCIKKPVYFIAKKGFFDMSISTIRGTIQ